MNFWCPPFSHQIKYFFSLFVTRDPSDWKGSIASDYFTDTELRSESSQCFYFFHSFNIGCSCERKFSSLNISILFYPTQIYGRISTWFSHFRESFWKLAQHPCDSSLCLSLFSMCILSTLKKNRSAREGKREENEWKSLLFLAHRKRKKKKINKKKKKMSAQFKIAVHCAKFISNAIDNFYVNENLLTLTLSDVKFNQLKRSNKSFKKRKEKPCSSSMI